MPFHGSAAYWVGVQASCLVAQKRDYNASSAASLALHFLCLLKLNLAYTLPSILLRYYQVGSQPCFGNRSEPHPRTP